MGSLLLGQEITGWEKCEVDDAGGWYTFLCVEVVREIMDDVAFCENKEEKVFFLQHVKGRIPFFCISVERWWSKWDGCR